MTIVKIVGIAILGMVTAGLLKEIKPSLAAFAGIVTGLVILVSLIDEFTGIINEFNKIAEIANVDGTLLSTVVKIIGVGYIAEFTATITDDYGFPSIGKKVLFGAKIVIILLALPVITGIIEAIGSIVG